MKYGFEEIAIANYLKAIESKKLSPRHVKDVIRWCRKREHLNEIEDSLKSEDNWVRKCLVEILGKIGNKKVIIEHAKKEQDKLVLFEMLKTLVSCKDGLEELVELLNSEDHVVKETVIQMFRRAGRSDCLFALIFSGDLELANRVKEYIREDEQKEHTEE